MHVLITQDIDSPFALATDGETDVLIVRAGVIDDAAAQLLRQLLAHVGGTNGVGETPTVREVAGRLPDC